MTKLPKRPRQHTLEALSERYVKSILPPEWIAQRTEQDYGLDLQVEIVKDEHVTGAHFTIQLKATDQLKVRKKSYIAHSCETSTLRYFLERSELVIYLVYDAQNLVGYWIWIQDYIRQVLDTDWQDQESATIKIPKDNIFDEKAIHQIEKRVLDAHSFDILVAAVRNAEDQNYKYTIATGDLISDLGKQGAIIGASLDIPGQTVTIGVHAKHQDALKDAPIQMKGTFRFDDTTEGQRARTLLNNVFKSGCPAKFDAQFFEGFDLPRVLRNVLSHVGKVSMHTIEISPIASDKRFTLKLSVLDTSGKDIAEIPYVECRLTQYGSEEVTYANDFQKIPLKFQLTVNYPKESVTFQLGLQFIGENVYQVRNLLQIQQALACAGAIKLSDIRTGLSTILEAPTQLLPEVDPNFMKVIEELAFVQEELRHPIVWPGEIDEADVRVLLEVVNILRTGRLRRRVSQFTISLPKNLIEPLVRDFAPGEPFQLGMESNGTAMELLGERLELGNCRIILPEVSWPQDSHLLRNKFAQLPEDASMEITLNVGEAGVQHIFHKWQKETQSSSDIT
jgi:hypothetical protein